MSYLCALYMFHRGRVGNVFSIPLYVLTCKVIDNKATLTLTLTVVAAKFQQSLANRLLGFIESMASKTINKLGNRVFSNQLHIQL